MDSVTGSLTGQKANRTSLLESRLVLTLAKLYKNEQTAKISCDGEFVEEQVQCGTLACEDNLG